EVQAEHLGDALVAAERGDLAEHSVTVRLRLSTQVLGQPARLPKRVLRSRRVRLPRSRLVRDAGTVPKRPDVREALDAEHRVHLHAPALVERQAEFREHRMRAGAGRPDEGAHGYPGAVRKDQPAGAGRARWPTPRLSSCLAAYRPRSVGISGRIFGAASTKTQCCGVALSSVG